MENTNLFNGTGQVNGIKLRTYRLYLELEAYVKLPLYRDHGRILAMFRCGNLSLCIEIGRFARLKTSVDQRTCFHCKENTENEIRFLIECPLYDEIRRKLFKKANLCNTDYDAFSLTDKLVFLMNKVLRF